MEEFPDASYSAQVVPLARLGAAEGPVLGEFPPGPDVGKSHCPFDVPIFPVQPWLTSISSENINPGFPLEQVTPEGA